MPTIDEIKAAVSHSVTESRDKYAPKLSFSDRCAALGLIRLGYTRDVVSRVFDLSVRTVARMTSRNQPAYQSVRRELEGLGDDEFIAKYVTLEHVAKANSFVSAVTAIEKGEAPNPRATHKAGMGVLSSGTPINIIWSDEDLNKESPRPTYDEPLATGAGWYFNTPDDKNTWFGAFMTSAEAFRYAEERL